MKLLKKFFNNFEEYMASIVLIVVLLVLTQQVILRSVFNSGYAWSEELARYLMFWFVFLAASQAVSQKAHIKIEAAITIFPKAIRKWIMMIGNIAFFVYCVFMTYYGTIYTYEAFKVGQIAISLRVPMGLFTAGLPVSHALMAIRIVQVNIIGAFLIKPLSEEVS